MKEEAIYPFLLCSLNFKIVFFTVLFHLQTMAKNVCVLLQTKDNLKGNFEFNKKGKG